MRLSPAIPLWEMSSQLLGSSSPWDGAFFFSPVCGHRPPDVLCQLVSDLKTGSFTSDKDVWWQLL